MKRFAQPGKPNPAVFFEVARQLSAQPKECVVIEDSVAGVAAARHAGMGCIAVCTTNPGSALSAADIVVDSLEKLTLDAFN